MHGTMGRGMIYPGSGGMDLGQRAGAWFVQAVESIDFPGRLTILQHPSS